MLGPELFGGAPPTYLLGKTRSSSVAKAAHDSGQIQAKFTCACHRGMAHNARTAAYDILERLARNLANCDDRGVREAIQDGPQHLSALSDFGRAWPTIRMRLAWPIRVPRKRIPQHGAIGDTQFVQAPPDHSRARLGPRTHSIGDALRREHARNPVFKQQSFAGKGHARETAALIAGGFPNQHKCWTTGQVLFKTSQTLACCIVGAIQRIGVRPRIEHIGCREALQIPEQRPVRLWIQAARLAC